jgi:hypothetical protein
VKGLLLKAQSCQVFGKGGEGGPSKEEEEDEE